MQHAKNYNSIREQSSELGLVVGRRYMYTTILNLVWSDVVQFRTRNAGGTWFDHQCKKMDFLGFVSMSKYTYCLHLTLPQTSSGFYLYVVQFFLKNTVGKGEIARNEQFLPFPRVLFTRFENFLPFSSNLILSSAKSFILEESKIFSFRKGLR